MKDDVQKDDATQLTPEQAIASQLEGFTEAVNSTPVVGKTEIAKPAQSAEELAKAEQEQAAKEAAEAAAKLAADERQKVLDGLSAKDLQDVIEKSKQFDTLRSALDKVAGKFGSVEQQIAKLSETKAATTAQLTEEDVADLQKEYGPELATALLKVLNKFGQKIAAPTPDAAKPATQPAGQVEKVEDVLAAVTKSVDEKVTATTRAIELKMLKREHPDWMQLVQVYDKDGKFQGFNPEFVAWAATLPADEQDRLYNGWDLEFNTAKIGDYKTYRKTQADAAKAAATKDKAQVAGRLKAGVIPKGIPNESTTKSALEEQREGYLQAM